VGEGTFSALNVYINVLEHWEDADVMFCLQLMFQGCLQIQELETGFF